MPSIALIGDYSAAVVAHQAIPAALERICREDALDLAWHWIRTRELGDVARELKSHAAVWVVPASPYENTAGVLEAIRWARETKRPFLGTCGGFQHALIEFSRNLFGVAAANHAETNPEADQLVVTRLSCALDKSDALSFSPKSRLREIYGSDSAQEGYRCSYGLNSAYRARFEAAGLRFTAFDQQGDPRAAELAAAVHPFFIGTLFQPERAALHGKTPPLVRAFAHGATAFHP